MVSVCVGGLLTPRVRGWGGAEHRDRNVSLKGAGKCLERPAVKVGHPLTLGYIKDPALTTEVCEVYAGL